MSRARDVRVQTSGVEMLFSRLEGLSPSHKCGIRFVHSPRENLDAMRRRSIRSIASRSFKARRQTSIGQTMTLPRARRARRLAGVLYSMHARRTGSTREGRANAPEMRMNFVSSPRELNQPSRSSERSSRRSSVVSREEPPRGRAGRAGFGGNPASP